MGLRDNERPERRQMVLFFLIDKSGSMAGEKIGSVNDAMQNMVPMIVDISNSNDEGEIAIAALEFATDTKWAYDKPIKVTDYIPVKVQAEGLTSLGQACLELNQKLDEKEGGTGFLTKSNNQTGYFEPAIILLSDGGPTDNFEAGLNTLKANKWFKHAIKMAIAIGEDADLNILEQFTGSKESIVRVKNLDALKAMIKLIAITSSQIGSQSKASGSKTKQQQVEEKIADQIADTKGAETANAPKTDEYDEWD